METIIKVKFYKWTIIGKELTGTVKNKYILCKCDCGTEKSIRINCLKNGLTKSCGCKSKTRLGESRSSVYILWKVVKRRVSENHYAANYYYNRGISMCIEWSNDYLAFKKWCLENGYKKGLQIDRINNNGNYCPDNCRFVTISENGRNKRNNRTIEYNGQTIVFKSFLEQINRQSDDAIIWRRIKLGWTTEKALTDPIRRIKRTYT